MRATHAAFHRAFILNIPVRGRKIGVGARYLTSYARFDRTNSILLWPKSCKPLANEFGDLPCLILVAICLTRGMWFVMIDKDLPI